MIAFTRVSDDIDFVLKILDNQNEAFLENGALHKSVNIKQIEETKVQLRKLFLKMKEINLSPFYQYIENNPEYKEYVDEYNDDEED